MSQYGDYNDKIFQSSNNIPFQDSNNSQGQFIDFHHNFVFGSLRVANIQYQQKFQQNKQILVDTNISNFEDIRLKNQNQIRTSTILQTGYYKKRLYLQCKKGSPQQTMDLNINFKTIICRFMKDLGVLKLLSKAQKQSFLQYKSQGANFQSLKRFIHKKKNSNCRKHLLNILQSSQIVNCIFLSNMQIRGKLKMIKFVEIMRKSIYQQNGVKRWKANN